MKRADYIDSIKAEKGRAEALSVLYRAMNCWNNMDKFRKSRRRSLNYQHGKQWCDKIIINGKEMSEEKYLISQGNIPLKNNLINRLVRSVLGVFRSQNKEPICVARDREEQGTGETMSTVLQYNWQMNRISDINARSLEDFLNGGLVCHKKTFGWRRRTLDCWTDYVNPNRFFVDPHMEDFRMWDCTIVGQIHDVHFTDLCAEFAKSPEDYKTLQREYSIARDASYLESIGEGFGHSDMDNLDFLVPSDPTMCRVIEVWTKETRPGYRIHDYAKGEASIITVDELKSVKDENAKRIKMARAAGVSEEEIQEAIEHGESSTKSIRLIYAEFCVDDYWYFRYLTPTGKVLYEGETPYAHGEHPYVFRCYPFIDGEIHSFVSDLIDQQRYINRLITLNDFIVRASAKGVLLIPEEALGGRNPDEFAEQWAKFNGVIVYTSKNGTAAPHQVASNSTNIGLHELLKMELQFLEDESGVHGALQGKPGTSATSGVLYQQQAQNATITLLDILDTFDSFIRECAYKDVENIKQFYEDEKVFNIAGRPGAFVTYKPETMSKVQYDFAIEESASSAAYREKANDFLMQMFNAKAITANDVLEFGNFPFGDALSQRITSRQEQQASAMGVPGQQMEGVPQTAQLQPEQQELFERMMAA